MVEQLLAQVTPLEVQVQTLSGSLEDNAAELHAKALSLERTTAAKDDYQKKNTWLSKKLDGESPLPFQFWPIQLHKWHYALFAVAVAELKTIVENVVQYFYLTHSDAMQRAPELLDSLPTRSREVIQTNMLKASSLTLGILKSLYPRADLDAAGEGFAATCSDEEANELVKGFLDTATKIIEMIPSAPM
jgi:hypothetical protein